LIFSFLEMALHLHKRLQALIGFGKRKSLAPQPLFPARVYLESYDNSIRGVAYYSEAETYSFKMVATSFSSSSRYFVGAPLVDCETVRQSSFRSVTSTHSRRSLLKTDSLDNSDNSQQQQPRRVRFLDCMDIDESDCYSSFDESGFEAIEKSIQPTVYEYEPTEPFEALYLTPDEILKIRSDARKQAVHFAQVYPSYVAAINETFDTIGTCERNFSQIEKLRRRRRRRDPFEVAFESSDRDEDNFFEEEQNTEKHCEFSQLASYDDDLFDDVEYFCSMRGLETRISPLFRINRRLTIKSVLDIQREMKKSGCCPAQVQMGLRAVCAQASQKARAFASFQADLDEIEVYKSKV
jgi:hypothetical protein